MTIAQLYRKMLLRPELTSSDAQHLTRVWAYAKTIGELEGLDAGAQFLTEAAAIVHDIACPYLRRTFGDANGKLQEQHSQPLLESFFADTDFTRAQIDRISYLVAHHHSPEAIDGIDFQILIEADYLVNADDGGLSRENVQNMRDRYFRTAAGRELLEGRLMRA